MTHTWILNSVAAPSEKIIEWMQRFWCAKTDCIKYESESNGPTKYGLGEMWIIYVNAEWSLMTKISMLLSGNKLNAPSLDVCGERVSFIITFFESVAIPAGP